MIIRGTKPPHTPKRAAACRRRLARAAQTERSELSKNVAGARARVLIELAHNRVGWMRDDRAEDAGNVACKRVTVEIWLLSVCRRGFYASRVPHAFYLKPKTRDTQTYRRQRSQRAALKCKNS